jgi:hypothetical protein
MKRFIEKLAKPIRAQFILARQKYFDDFIFIHIHRTGGTSVKRALGIRSIHMTALETIEKLGQNRWNSKFTFTIVRNPWDQVVSHYHHRIRTNRTNLQVNPVRFTKWVKRVYDEKDPYYQDTPKMTMPQSDWITDSEGEILVNFIARFERLEEDFRAICEHLNLQSSLPHLNISQHGDYRGYYDIETTEIVAKCFSKDIKLFRYSF